MALKDIVDVQISRQTAAITRVGFGTLLFVYETDTAASVRVAQYGDIDEVAEDFSPGDAAYDAALAAFSGDLRPSRIKIGYKLDSETWQEALDEIIDFDNDWYALTVESRDAADILSIAQYVEARTKLFLAASADADILDPNDDTDIGSDLLSASYSRTALIYHSQAAAAYPEVAWAGGQLPSDPGSITWAFKALPGIPSETFTGAEITALESKRVTRYELVAGLGRTVGGYTSDPGAFIDIIRGIDWLQQRMAEDVFLQLANRPKIPYTDAGIGVIESVVRARLQVAIERDVIADDDNLTVTVPQVLDVDPNDRAQRVLRNVRFTGRLAGAIHQVIIRGTVTA